LEVRKQKYIPSPPPPTPPKKLLTKKSNQNKYIYNPVTTPSIVVHDFDFSCYSGGRGRRISSSRPACARLARPYLKNKTKQNKQQKLHI
jgi:hypothetical protein